MLTLDHQIFEKMDEDADGKVTLEEWLTWIADQYKTKEATKAPRCDPSSPDDLEEGDTALPTSHLLARLRTLEDLAAAHALEEESPRGVAGGRQLGWQGGPPESPPVSAWAYLLGRARGMRGELQGEAFRQEACLLVCFFWSGHVVR